MKNVLSVENMRKSDAYTISTSTPSRELMHRAAQGILQSASWHGRIAIVCGYGNNAGDGYALALLLNEMGHTPELILLDERFSPDGEYYFNKCKEKKIKYSIFEVEGGLNGFDIIVDCIFGTGFKSVPEGKAKEAIEQINSSGAYIISADINSGLNADNGIAELCVKSDLTVSIGGYKSGHFLNQAKDKITSLKNVDIGIEPILKPYKLFEAEDATELLYKRDEYSHKGTYGYVSLIGGSPSYSGAIKLANLSSSAVRSGAGVVRLCVPSKIAHSVMPYILESTLYQLSENETGISFSKKELDELISSSASIGIGMGLGKGEDNLKIISYLIEEFKGTLLIDADGLNALSQNVEILKKAKGRVVLTPHLKEFERLSGHKIEQINNSPIEYAKRFAKEYGVILLLKGTCTIITDGEEVTLSNTGCSGMAKGGSGDVLSGIITALCADAYRTPYQSVCLGAYINGVAGEISQNDLCDISMSSYDTAMNVARAIKSLTQTR